MLIQILWIVLLMGIVPILLGLPWVDVIKPKHKLCFAYSSGFFVSLALFQLVSLPVAFSYGKFSTIIVIYSVVLFFVCSISIWYSWRKRILLEIHPKAKMHWLEWVYLISFLLVFGIQVVRGFTYDITYMSYDDSIYTVIASDALYNNSVASIDYYSGIRGTLDIKYGFSLWNVFPAYYSAISGIHVTTISHTIQYVQMLVLAYTTYWFLAGEVFEKRENQLAFMIIVSLFYWFGYHSHYSLSFRLLGPNYQGKAVLAVSLTPLVFSTLIQTIEKPFAKRMGFFFSIISVSAVTLSLWGAGTMIVIICVPLLLSLFRKKRIWKQILYIPWACLVPVLSLCFYIYNKFAL